MPARIRLQRRGKKKQAFYHIVVADGRAPRDGRFIEKIGTYNPLTIPASIELNFERALYWVNCGVQPSETVRAILRREGVYMKKHLMGGVQKGAFDEAEANKRFETWKTEKLRKISDYKLEVLNKNKSEAKQRLEVENKVKEAKEAILNEKRMAEMEKERKIKEEAEAKAAAERAEKEAQKAAEAETAAEQPADNQEAPAESIEAPEENTEIKDENTEKAE
ncbi:MAG: 30S ribosomal protein S16 [Bacteroidales bacterium]|jgi:small subunit ribosomal protein S16|nr:30S ribosomal protein S16 [Bacteroidales bacterium]MDD2688260.1 30S ribosomal protein S16 [Bacteroidales bacterium]MDD3330608.1 30S ribosomal protein S16 [Bacteroidales bacterium]MDD3691032.1 30S ribosomal protein S16 [Bacteroidales bacterium]MDD4045098.1 30S ribosomal protein S16 [Bacteroidales bacterium]